MHRRLLLPRTVLSGSLQNPVQMCINSCCAWCAQKPAQGAQLDHLIFVFATDANERHPHLTIIRQHWLDGCIIKLAFESGVQDPQLDTARLRSEYSSLSSAFQALNNSREGSILVHDPPQVLVSVDLVHSLLSKHQGPLFDHNRLISVRQSHL